MENENAVCGGHEDCMCVSCCQKREYAALNRRVKAAQDLRFTPGRCIEVRREAARRRAR